MGGVFVFLVSFARVVSARVIFPGGWGLLAEWNALVGVLKGVGVRVVV